MATVYDVATVQDLRQTLMSLDVLLVPDLQQSSGGRHLQRVLDQLAIPAADMPAVQSLPVARKRWRHCLPMPVSV
jgi:hypothetical protein